VKNMVLTVKQYRSVFQNRSFNMFLYLCAKAYALAQNIRPLLSKTRNKTFETVEKKFCKSTKKSLKIYKHH